MPRTTKIPTGYPKHFLFQRIKMALGFCGYCSARSTYDMEMRGVTGEHVDSLTRYKVCRAHASTFTKEMLDAGAGGTIEYAIPATVRVVGHTQN